MQDLTQKVKVYSIFIFLVALAGVFNEHGLVRILFVSVILTSIGLWMMKRWALYALGCLSVAWSIFIVWWFIRFQLMVGVDDMVLTPGSGVDPIIGVSLGVFLAIIMLAYFSIIIVPTYFFFKERKFFN